MIFLLVGGSSTDACAISSQSPPRVRGRVPSTIAIAEAALESASRRLWHCVHLVQFDRYADALGRWIYRQPIEVVASMLERYTRPRRAVEHDARALLNDRSRHLKSTPPGRSGYQPRDPGDLVRPVAVDLAHNV